MRKDGKKSDKEILSLVPTFILGKSESVNFLDETAGTIFCVDLSFESFGQRFALDEKSLGGKNRHFATQLLRLSPCDIFNSVFVILILPL